jgi:uroporphyrinogen decarboxylase
MRVMLDIPIKMDVPGLLRNLRREGTPDRTYFMELYLDAEVQDAIGDRFCLYDKLDRAHPHYKWQCMVALYRFLGYEAVRFALTDAVWSKNLSLVQQDTAGLERQGGRAWANEGSGPIASWADFERYPWPDPKQVDLSGLDWMERHLPEDMAIVAACPSVFQQTSRLFGFEGMCYGLADRPDLVAAVFDRVGAIALASAEILLQYDRVQILFGGDDMGFKSGLLVSPQVLLKHSLPWHQRMAALAHSRNKLFLLHSCGNIRKIVPYLIDEVHVDGRHSFEDGIEPVTEAKKRWGDRLAILGGIDMDFLCRANESQVRQRVRETLEVCLPGGGYCLGTGNSVANYVPLDNYLTMLDEGRRFTA